MDTLDWLAGFVQHVGGATQAAYYLAGAGMLEHPPPPPPPL
jgi:hypothetical protein